MALETLFEYIKPVGCRVTYPRLKYRCLDSCRIKQDNDLACNDDFKDINDNLTCLGSAIHTSGAFMQDLLRRTRLSHAANYFYHHHHHAQY